MTPNAFSITSSTSKMPTRKHPERREGEGSAVHPKPPRRRTQLTSPNSNNRHSKNKCHPDPERREGEGSAVPAIPRCTIQAGVPSDGSSSLGWKPSFGLSGITNLPLQTIATQRTNVILERSEGSAVHPKPPRRRTQLTSPNSNNRHSKNKCHPDPERREGEGSAVPAIPRCPIQAGVPSDGSSSLGWKPSFGLSGITNLPLQTIATQRTNVILERSEGSAVHPKPPRRRTQLTSPNSNNRHSKKKCHPDPERREGEGPAVPATPGCPIQAGVPSDGSSSLGWKPSFGLSGITNLPLQTIATQRTNVILTLSVAKGKDLRFTQSRPAGAPS